MDVKYVSTKPLEEFAINQKHKADDLISRQDAIGKIKDWMKFIGYSHSERNVMECTIQMLAELPGIEIVRCKDCSRWCICHHSDDWFCADGERRTDG